MRRQKQSSTFLNFHRVEFAMDQDLDMAAEGNDLLDT